MSTTNGCCGCGCGTKTSIDRNGEPRRFLRGHNRRLVKSNGWVEQGHRYISVDGKRIAEHRFLMEQHLGRSLGPDEVVHHVDHNSVNNEIDNLVILTRAEHMRLHAKGTRRRWTAEEKARAVELYVPGMSLDEVADALGRPYSSTRLVIAKAGVSRRPHETRNGRRERHQQEVLRAA